MHIANNTLPPLVGNSYVWGFFSPNCWEQLSKKAIGVESGWGSRGAGAEVEKGLPIQMQPIWNEDDLQDVPFSMEEEKEAILR